MENPVLKLLRKGILLYVLLLVAGGHWLSVKRTTSWERPLQVVVHPINGDGSPRSDEYIGRLDADAFDGVAAFINEEAAHHGVALDEPMRMVLGRTVTEQPPMPPAGAGTLSIMLWSLKLRYWAWQVDRGDDPPSSDIEIYVRYFDPDAYPRLAHSLGLQKGLIGVVNAYGSRDQAGSNRVIIAHEILHTLGATDKYDSATGQPLYPDGYAEPHASPRHPQDLAELMGGRIPVTAATSTTPVSLQEVVVGSATAREIRWR